MNWCLVPVAILLGGCDFTLSRPDQDNFTIHASKQQAERFVEDLSRQFAASVDPQGLNGLGNDSSRMFWLNGPKAELTITPVPDDRCDPNASVRSTYNQGEYRIDLVYRSASEAARKLARRTLIQSAQEAGLKITEFKEC